MIYSLVVVYLIHASAFIKFICQFVLLTMLSHRTNFHWKPNNFIIRALRKTHSSSYLNITYYLTFYRMYINHRHFEFRCSITSMFLFYSWCANFDFSAHAFIAVTSGMFTIYISFDNFEWGKQILCTVY